VTWLRRVEKIPLPLVSHAGRRLLRGVAKGANPETTKFVYVGLLTALLILLGVMPTLSLADLTYRWSLEQELDAEVAHVKRAWLRRQEKIISIYGNLKSKSAVKRSEERSDFYASREFTTEIATKCSEPSDHHPLMATADFLSVGDIISSSLAAPLSSIIPAARPRGSYMGAVICQGNGSRLTATDDTGIAETVAIQGRTQPGLPLGGWWPWCVGIPLLFWACWWAVGLFRKRVCGFLDRWPTPQRGVLEGRRMTTEGWKLICDEGERDVLRHVARRELVPRRHEDAAKRLVVRGLIRFQPLPQQVSAQLEQYALFIAPTPAASGTPSRALPWRPIFSVGLLAAAVFIYVTQQSGSIALVTGLTSILPLLVRITDAVTASGGVKGS
jgi:hypothetical protein